MRCTLFPTISFPGCILEGYDYIPYVNMCVKIYTINSTWVGSNEICQNDGGKLVSITTLAQWEAMSNYLSCKWTANVHQYRS